MAKKKKKRHESMSWQEEGRFRKWTGQKSSDFDYADMEIASFMAEEMEKAMEERKREEEELYDDPSQLWLPF